ncbi:hypothetical protein SAMN02745121_00284 [Nannocystis exedens]|uniref:TIGR02646 family protein n=1 Tax=Nannocystis exedens TaxID=54 RepID=A0A1I1SUK8_9BACT|nr:hypothetical protein [Nannocystis exedens]PCC75743.1 hypothetical protein NAEX_08856 [Nannocystis exedens]SFD50145.1 hypothetical protein SAMN02745121_00284 [Nannocystis exedens]
MIRCERTEEPPNFDAEVRRPGNGWLEKNPHKRRPRDFWVVITSALAAAFKQRCAYSAIAIYDGQVDHFVSCHEDRSLAYEWSNYRYCSPSINSRKNRVRASELLDPCMIEDDWFELILPSLQLRVTERCPAEQRERANNAIARLGLRDGEPVIRYHRAWLEHYERNPSILDVLDEVDPLLARAIRKRDGL